MALNDPLHQIDTFDLEQVKPRLPWTKKEFDGFNIRNRHEQRLAERDQELLDLIKLLRSRGVSKTSPQYPFKADAPLSPSSVVALDGNGDAITDFVIDISQFTIPIDFIKDLKLVLPTEFSDPYLSKITFHETTDPVTGLIVIFVDLEISARYSVDQLDHVILTLTQKAYNDVQDNSEASSRDDVPFRLEPQQVAGLSFLLSGVIEFEFIGSIQSQLSTSWSVGEYQGVTVEGFSAIADLEKIEFTFTRQKASFTQLVYTTLGDLASTIPFIDKVKNFPFNPVSDTAFILTKYIVDLNITGPVNRKVYIKRIRKKTVGSDTHYVFVFSYNNYDSNGNFIEAVNIGVAEVTPGDTVAEILSLGSNKINGVDPTWDDEDITDTVDSLGRGRLEVLSYDSLEQLFNELFEATIGGSPTESPIVSPANPSGIVGIDVDIDVIVMVENNSYIDHLAVDVSGLPITIFERELDPTVHLTRNVQISIDGVTINNRTVYGNEAIMRDFYGLGATDSLVDNDNIPLGDTWIDTDNNLAFRYDIVSGKRRWRAF